MPKVKLVVAIKVDNAEFAVIDGNHRAAALRYLIDRLNTDADTVELLEVRPAQPWSWVDIVGWCFTDAFETTVIKPVKRTRKTMLAAGVPRWVIEPANVCKLIVTFCATHRKLALSLSAPFVYKFVPLLVRTFHTLKPYLWLLFVALVLAADAVVLAGAAAGMMRQFAYTKHMLVVDILETLSSLVTRESLTALVCQLGLASANIVVLVRGIRRRVEICRPDTRRLSFA